MIGIGLDLGEIGQAGSGRMHLAATRSATLSRWEKKSL
jgi:hypothetical protein